MTTDTLAKLAADNRGSRSGPDRSEMHTTPQHTMTNTELQEAITMANAMVKSAAPDRPNFKDLQNHLATLLKLQQMRAATAYMPHEAQAQETRQYARAGLPSAISRI